MPRRHRRAPRSCRLPGQRCNLRFTAVVGALTHELVSFNFQCNAPYVRGTVPTPSGSPRAAIGPMSHGVPHHNVDVGGSAAWTSRALELCMARSTTAVAALTSLIDRLL